MDLSNLPSSQQQALNRAQRNYDQQDDIPAATEDFVYQLSGVVDTLSGLVDTYESVIKKIRKELENAP